MPPPYLILFFNTLDQTISDGSPYVKIGFTLDISSYNHGKFNGRLSLLRQVRDEVSMPAGTQRYFNVHITLNMENVVCQLGSH